MTKQEYGSRYIDLGYSIIPACPRSKTPLIQWAEHQSRRATKEELARWLKRWPEMGMGLVTGRISGVVAFDVDSEEGLREAEKRGGFPVTPQSITGGRGRHFILKHPGEGELRNFAARLPGVDFRGDGGYIILPPSEHPSGRPYQWAPGLSPFEVEHAPMRPWMLKLFPAAPKAQPLSPSSGKGWLWQALQGVPRGQRNSTCARLAGHYLAKGLCLDEVKIILSQWNQKNQPPLSQKELMAAIESIGRADARSTPAPAAARQPPRFPPHCMGGAAGQFARLYSQHSEAPASFYFMSFLTFLGILIDGQVTLKISEGITPTRLYTVLVGESGFERKSSVLKNTELFFLETLTDDALSVCHGAGSAEGLCESLKERPRLVLVMDEFKALTAKGRIDGSVLLPMITTLFERTRYENRTRKAHIDIREGRLALLGACTTETYQGMFDGAALDIGLVNRLFVVHEGSQRRFPFPMKIPQQEKAAIQSRLGEILAFVAELSRRGTYQFPMADEAFRAYSQWYQSFPWGPEPTRRLDSIGARLMLLLAVNEMKSLIDLEVVERVLRVMDYQHAVREMTEPLGAESPVARAEQDIRRALERCGPTKIKGHGGLKHRTHYERYGIYLWWRAFENLKGEGEIFHDQKDGKAWLVGDETAPKLPQTAGAVIGQ